VSSVRSTSTSASQECRHLDSLLLDDGGSGDLLDGGDDNLLVDVLLIISGGDGDLLEVVDGDVLDAGFSITSSGVDPIRGDEDVGDGPSLRGP
jgi:hypothetical protein